MIQIKIKNIFFFRILRKFFVLLGIFSAAALVLALTSAPYWGYHWLGTSKSELRETPQYIVLLGGGGMPSQSNLMRSWFTAHAARNFPDAKVIIAMPGNVQNSASTPRKMKDELVLRGVDERSILFETQGTNTRWQALNCAQMIASDTPILLVSSPEHMRRAVLCFRKVGFEKVNALPAFENAAEANFSFNDDALGGNELPLPDVGQSINLRYQVWNHLKYEILLSRELFALFYYRLRGWI